MTTESTTGSATGPKKARVAMINLDDPTVAILRDCFKQFGIQTIVVPGTAIQRLQKETFEACVLRLQDDAEAILRAVRASPFNRRSVIYGISGNLQEALEFSKYGINALLGDPVEGEAALKVVRATHLAVKHELRRYVRVPIVTEVLVDIKDQVFSATSQEISDGGMSLKIMAPLTLAQPVQLSFTLPNTPRILLRALVCWKNSTDNTFGVRFDPSNERGKVKKWIYDYLEIS